VVAAPRPATAPVPGVARGRAVDRMRILVHALPQRGADRHPVQEQLIVELYSK
jgi:hypothetical protein